MKKLTHIDENGTARMVNVEAKGATARVAIAQAMLELAPETLRLLLEGGLPKGDALGCARIGGIMAAKRAAELIPLCHPIPLDVVDINFEITEDPPAIKILAETRCHAKTGVEMEAIIAAQTAAAIIYDMAKAVQRDMLITGVRLLYKNGGKSGEFRAPDFTGSPGSRS